VLDFVVVLVQLELGLNGLSEDARFKLGTLLISVQRNINIQNGEKGER
jgi:hypothetical protein